MKNLDADKPHDPILSVFDFCNLGTKKQSAFQNGVL